MTAFIFPAPDARFGLYLADLTGHPFFYLSLIAIFGACLGSFANAAAMRLVRDESPVSPPSRCRFCDRPLKWYQNIPLLGWLAVRGKSACCDSKLPLRYIAAELGFALICCQLFLFLPITHALVMSFVALIGLIALMTDSEALILHPPSLLAGMIAGLLATLIVPGWPLSWLEAASGLFVGAALVIIVNAVYQSIRGRYGFGSGDIWLLGMIGAVLGPIASIIIFFTASFLGALVGIALILSGKAIITSKLPFGLFLSVVFLLYPALNMLFI